MAIWTFNDDTAASLRISGLNIRFQSQATSTAAFKVSDDLDADLPFDQGETVIIKKDTTQWFYGRVIPIPRTGEPRFQHASVVLADPWWYLENLVYEQDWTLLVDGAVIPSKKSRVVLGQDPNGNSLSTGAVIADVLAFEIAAGAPFQVGTIDPDLIIPYDECLDLTCAEVVRRMLRYSPDCVTWFDHTTTPPTFHCRRRANLTTVSYPCLSGKPVKRLDISPREDLRVPAVVLKYEKTDTLDDVSYESVTVDKYPLTATGREWGAMIATIQLAGMSASYLSQRIASEQIPDDLSTNEDWWKQYVPWLFDSSISSLQLKLTPRTGSLQRILLEGTIQDWMNEDAEEETICAKVNYKKTVDGVESEFKDQDVSVRVMTTNALSTTYRRLSDYTEGEAVPEGLAEKIYNAVSTLHFDGSFGISEKECTRSLRMGLVLNLTGGQPEWTSMKALIQEVTEDIDSGRTDVVFGPPGHLGFGDLVELLRANRRRGISGNVVSRSSGRVDDSSKAIALSGKTPNSSSGSGQPTPVKLVVVNGNKKITLDPATLGNGESVELREMDVFTELKWYSPTLTLYAKKMKVLATAGVDSAPYIVFTGKVCS